MTLFRLRRKKYLGALTGAGAALYGARWNSPGVELIYTAGNRSLAMAEVAVHLSLGSLPEDYYMTSIYIPGDLSQLIIKEMELPQNWNSFPYLDATRITGDEFVKKGQYLSMRVPSAVTKGDWNILINPAHPDFSKVQVLEDEKFPIDHRIFI